MIKGKKMNEWKKKEITKNPNKLNKERMYGQM